MSLSQKRMPPLLPTPTRRDQHNLVLQTTSGSLRGTREAAETEAKSLVCSGVGWSWAQVMALLFTCCVTLGKLLKLYASPFLLFLFFSFPLFLNGDHNPSLTGLLACSRLVHELISSGKTQHNCLQRPRMGLSTMVQTRTRQSGSSSTT